MQSLQRLREPVAIVLLVVLALRLLVGVVTFVVLSGGGADDTWAVLSRSAYGDNSFALASFSLASSALDALTAVVLVALVATCLVWRPTPRARALALASAVVLLLGVVLSLVSALVWLASVGLSLPALADFARLVLAVTLPIVGAVVLWRMLPERALVAIAPSGEAPAVGTSGPSPALPQAAPPTTSDDQPTWQPEEAAGAAWLSAGDAATGAAASGWGTSADRGGWVPAPGATGTPRQEPYPQEHRDR